MAHQPLVIAAIGAAAVVTAITVNVLLWQDEVSEQFTPKFQQVSGTKTPAKDQDRAPSAVPVPPSFDVVRVGPGGDAVIAGRAEPDSIVVIIDNGKVLGEVTADGRGEWVFVPGKPLAPGSRQLSLEMRVADGAAVISDDVVVMVVPERDKDIAGRPVVKPSGALALKVPRTGGGGTVMQTPGGGTGRESLGLSVDILDYDDDGRLTISGKADPGAQVRLYLDNAFIGRAGAGAGGQWRLSPETRIAPGLYTLRADQMDDAGKVAARVSLPFSRAEPMADASPEPFVIVQPGNSLWRLARRAYGSGVRYTMIFKANKEQIRDPDLIYPGQIFAVPVTN